MNRGVFCNSHKPFYLLSFRTCVKVTVVNRNGCLKVTIKQYVHIDGAWSDENDVADAGSPLRPKIPNVSGFSDSSSMSSVVAASVRRQLPWSPCKRPSVLPIRKQTSIELSVQRRNRRVISPTSPTAGVVSSLSS
jgi:hypothetical protein